MAAKKSNAKKKRAQSVARKAKPAKRRTARAKPARAAKAVKAKPVRPARTQRKPPTPRARPRARDRSGRPAHIPAGPTELDTIKLAYLFRDTSAADIYRAFMDSALHSLFTGDRAEIDPRVGGIFRLYGGFIEGTTLELVADARIVQSWRTRHFPRNNPNSTLELTLTPVAEGTRLEMRHLDVPKDQVEYLVSGWVTYYLDPLARHLGKRASLRPPPL
jgi:uncharacterized protein YndB with AHSA1/START domain